MTKVIYKRKDLFGALIPEEQEFIHYHHGGEAWEQADIAVRAVAEIAHLEPQTGSRKSKLGMAGGC